MSQHPAGIFNPARPFALGPPAPLYFSELSAPHRKVCFLAELDVDAITEVTELVQPMGCGPFHSLSRIDQTITQLVRSQIRYATHPLITSVDDTPGNTPIDGIMSPINLERRLGSAGGMFASVANSAASTIDLNNAEGELDEFDSAVVSIGREVRLSVAAMTGDTVVGDTIFDVLVTGDDDYLVTETEDRLSIGSGGSASVLSGFGPIYRGIVDSIGWTKGNVQIGVRDFRERLEQKIQQSRYSGTGGIGGSEELKDVSKPAAYGRCNNIKPTLIDPVRLIYQFHYGEARSVDAVRDMGVELDFHSRLDTFTELFDLVPPSAESDGDFPLGSFATCPGSGCFRLAGQPAGIVTADVRGAGGADSLREAFSDGTLFTDGTGWANLALKIYSRTAGSIIIRLLIDQAGLTSADVALAQIAQRDAERPYEVGLYLPAGGQMTVITAIAELCRSWGFVLIRSKDGRYQVRDLAPPGETPVARITPGMLDEHVLERVTLPYRQPWSDIDVSYGRNWQPLSDNELAGAVAASERATLTRGESIAQTRNSTLGIIYPQRSSARIDSLLTQQADAIELGERFLAMYPHGRKMFTGPVLGLPYRLELLDTVELTHPRFGLSQGVNCLVVGISENGLSGATELELFGGTFEVGVSEEPPPDVDPLADVSLREDGGDALRQDSGLELRE